MNLTEIVQSPRWKKFTNFIYGWGASIVLIGALFKIQHYDYAGEFLTVGLLTEAVIFFFSAFESPHEQPDWSLVYPELIGLESNGNKRTVSNDGVSVEGLEQLQQMLEKISVQPDKLSHLSTGIEKLTKTTEQLSDISNVATATNGYVDQMNKVSESVQNLSDSYKKTATAIENSGASIQSDLGKMTENSNSMSSSMASASKNLSSLNAIYEMQLKESTNQMNTSKDLNKVMETLNASLANAEAYKRETDKLNQNLAALNTIYGNMLSAMSQKSN